VVDPVVINIIAGSAIGLGIFIIFFNAIKNIIGQIIKIIEETYKTIGEIIVKKSDDLIDFIQRHTPSLATIVDSLIYLKSIIFFYFALRIGWVIGQIFALLLKK
jgi:Fe2+ transport system protein B